MDSFLLTDLHMYFDQLTLSDVFDFLYHDTNIQNISTMDTFMEQAQAHKFCSFRRDNMYVPGNSSLLINVPYVINERDSIVKSFQLIKGFSGRYEFKIMNYETDYTVFGISDISTDISTDTGVLSIKYNHRVDNKVFNDPYIKTGTDVMILGLGIAEVLRIKKVILGDQATVNCDYNVQYPLRLTLFKNLRGQPGFYQKLGFTLRKDL